MNAKDLKTNNLLIYINTKNGDLIFHIYNIKDVTKPIINLNYTKIIIEASTHSFIKAKHIKKSISFNTWNMKYNNYRLSKPISREVCYSLITAIL